MHDMEVEVFGEALKDEDLLADLDALEAEEAAQQMGAPAEGVITSSQAEKYREEHGLNAPAQQQEA